MSISVFEIIGPVMIGPSSSHTAGMARIGLMANSIINEEPVHVGLTLHPAIRHTYSGHRTDAALIGGLLGIREDDDRIRDALSILEDMGIKHSIDFWEDSSINPNTVRIRVETVTGSTHDVQGISVGGGSILITSIDGFAVNLSGMDYVILVWSGQDISTRLGKNIGSKVEVCINGCSYLHVITLKEAPNDDLCKSIECLDYVTQVRIVEPVLKYGNEGNDIPLFKSYAELLEASTVHNKSIAELAIDYEVYRSNRSKGAIRDQMRAHLEVMKEACRQGLEEDIKLNFGLISGNDSKMLYQSIKQNNTLCGNIIAKAVAYALAIMEVNGSMGRVVAAPTAGSSGIVPGCFLSLQNEYALSDDVVIDAMFVSAIAGVIMHYHNASFSGAVGGCQAEIGVSSAIAAAGLVYLGGGDATQIVHGMAMAMKNLLGLICDTIAGPVEVPCIKRNSVGVANAFVCADMALADIKSYIPPDEVIDALVNTQRLLPSELKGTTIGGLACTRTAKMLRENICKGCLENVF